MNNLNLEQFRSLADESGYLFDIYDDGGQELRIVEDDGFLHIERFGQRFSFDIGQERSRNEFNRISRQIMNHLQIPRDLQGGGLII